MRHCKGPKEFYSPIEFIKQYQVQKKQPSVQEGSTTPQQKQSKASLNTQDSGAGTTNRSYFNNNQHSLSQKIINQLETKKKQHIPMKGNVYVTPFHQLIQNSGDKLVLNPKDNKSAQEFHFKSSQLGVSKAQKTASFANVYQQSQNGHNKSFFN